MRSKAGASSKQIRKVLWTHAHHSCQLHHRQAVLQMSVNVIENGPKSIGGEAFARWRACLGCRGVTPYEIAGKCSAQLAKISRSGMAAGAQLFLNCRQQALHLQIAYPEVQHERRSTPRSIFFLTASFQHSFVEAHHDGMAGTSGGQTDLGSLGNHVDIAGHESAKLLAARATNFESRRTGQLHDHVVEL